MKNLDPNYGRLKTPFDASRMSLTEALHRAGYYHVATPNAKRLKTGQKDIKDRATGEVVYTGSAHQVWRWMRLQNLIT